MALMCLQRDQHMIQNGLTAKELNDLKRSRNSSTGASIGARWECITVQKDGTTVNRQFASNTAKERRLSSTVRTHETEGCTRIEDE